MINNVGFVGFGEASFLIAEGLKSEGIEKIYAYDVNAHHEEIGGIIKKRAHKLNVVLTESLEELCELCNLIFCATSAKVAEDIAKNVSDYLSSKHLYIDINASSPMVQENISAYITEKNAKFVDVAVMDSVPSYKHKVPMFISGNGTEDFERFGDIYGLNLRFISENPGTSSAIKMFRSVFMKGITSLLIEALEASEKYNVSDLVLESLNQSVIKKPLEETTNLLVGRTAIHAERRVAEMSEVIKTLQMLEVNPLMSEAIKEKLRFLVDIDIRSNFDDNPPKSYKEVIKALKY